MSVVIFIPISRREHLQALFASLESLRCDANQTSLLTYVDGDDKLFLEARNLTEQSRFAQRLCIQRKPDNGFSNYSFPIRRKRIAAIKNESKRYLADVDYVFGIEDDTIVPPGALEQLLRDYAAKPHAGFIEGMELGRWGIPHVGAWRVDNVYEPTVLETLLPGDGLQEIDAGGFYCYLTKLDNYIAHEYAPFGNDVLGPDVNYGIWLRQQGLKNYIDWSINCEHRDGGKILTLENTQIKQVMMVKQESNWRLHVAG